MKTFYNIDFNSHEEQRAFTKAFKTAVINKYPSCDRNNIQLIFETIKNAENLVGIEITDRNVKSIPIESLDDMVMTGIKAAAQRKRRVSEGSSVETSSPRTPCSPYKLPPPF